VDVEVAVQERCGESSSSRANRRLATPNRRLATLNHAGAGGLCLSIATSGLTRLEQLRADALDLVILDRCRRTSTGSPSSRVPKDLDCGPPVIVLSALADVRSKTVCLEFGPCECVSRPVKLAELIARARPRERERPSGQAIG
jgi:DNA-binding response OmpR family regulator